MTAKERLMKTVLSMLFVILVGSEVTHAQRSATCTINNFQKNNGVYSFDIWERRTNPTGSLLVGTSQFFFDYSSGALSAPSLSNINPFYTGPAASTGDYLPMTVGIVGGKLAVTIRFIGNDLGAGHALSTNTPDGERMCTVNLTITDPQQLANLHWDEINSALTTTNLQPVIHTFIGSDETPLPITLISFTGTFINGNHERLHWATLSEISNYGFFVQRKSPTDTGWAELLNSFVSGHGTILEPHEYSFVDSAVSAGQWMYRLKQVDLDGTIHYTEPITIEMVTSVLEDNIPTEVALGQNYPNPFNPTTAISYQLPAVSFVSLKVYNLLGQEVATLVDDEKPMGRHTVVWNGRVTGGNHAASGVYVYRLEVRPRAGGDAFVSTKRMMLMK